RADAVETLLSGLLQPDRLERIVDAAVGHVADRLHRVVRGGVDYVRGAQLLRRRQLVLDDVHRNDHPRSRDAGALDRGEADATGAEHGDRGARRDLGWVERSAYAGRDAAADQRRAVERHVVRNLHDRVLVDEHLLGVAGEVRELVDRRAVPGVFGRIA